MDNAYIFTNTLIEIHASEMTLEEKKSELKKRFHFSDNQCNKCQDIFKYKLPVVHYVSYHTHAGTTENNFDYVYYCEDLPNDKDPSKNTANLREISRLIYMMLTWYIKAKGTAASKDIVLYEMHTGEKTHGKFTSAMRQHHEYVTYKYLLKKDFYPGDYRNFFKNICVESLIIQMEYLQVNDKEKKPNGTETYKVKGILLYS